LVFKQLEGKNATQEVNTNIGCGYFLRLDRAAPGTVGIAFSLAALAGKAMPASGTGRHSRTKKAKKHHIVAAMPKSLSGSVLKYLPGAAPKLHPRQKTPDKILKACRSEYGSLVLSLPCLSFC
jgi:hypothetical protein